MKRGILVFLKYPEPGRVKTRLAATLGDREAASAYRKMVCRVFEQCRLARPDSIFVAFDPPDRITEIRDWLLPWLEAFPGIVEWIPQSEGDLGARLEAAIQDSFEKMAEMALAVIGTDCVHLDREVFEEAWGKMAGDSDVVFGPSFDGGYYLVGMRECQATLFREIPWSSERTLESSLGAADRSGLKVHLLEKKRDVDTTEDWRFVEAEVSERRCVFFDRDGVVNRSPGPGYVSSVNEFVLNPGIAESLAWLKDRDWLAILVTSQRGVGKGLMSRKELDRIHQQMQIDLAASGGVFDGIYAFTGEPVCPHQPKPDPEMIVTAAESFFIDLRQSLMIGDADRDIEMGRSAGLATTVRIRGDKPINSKSEHLLESTDGILGLFKKILKL